MYIAPALVVIAAPTPLIKYIAQVSASSSRVCCASASSGIHRTCACRFRDNYAGGRVHRASTSCVIRGASSRGVRCASACRVVFGVSTCRACCARTSGEYNAPAPAVSYVAPAPALYASPTPVVEFIEPAPARGAIVQRGWPHRCRANVDLGFSCQCSKGLGDQTDSAFWFRHSNANNTAATQLLKLAIKLAINRLNNTMLPSWTSQHRRPIVCSCCKLIVLPSLTPPSSRKWAGVQRRRVTHWVFVRWSHEGVVGSQGGRGPLARIFRGVYVGVLLEVALKGSTRWKSCRTRKRPFSGILINSKEELASAVSGAAEPAKVIRGSCSPWTGWTSSMILGSVVCLLQAPREARHGPTSQARYSGVTKWPPHRRNHGGSSPPFDFGLSAARGEHRFLTRSQPPSRRPPLGVRGHLSLLWTLSRLVVDDEIEFDIPTASVAVGLCRMLLPSI